MRLYLYENSKIYMSHDLMTYISQSTDFGQIIKVKIFVQGRLSRPINGSKIICHICMGQGYRNFEIQIGLLDR